jgi:hypothetical protein
MVLASPPSRCQLVRGEAPCQSPVVLLTTVDPNKIKGSDFPCFKHEVPAQFDLCGNRSWSFITCLNLSHFKQLILVFLWTTNFSLNWTKFSVPNLIILYELSSSAKKAFTHSSCTHDFFSGVMRVDEKEWERLDEGKTGESFTSWRRKVAQFALLYHLARPARPRILTWPRWKLDAVELMIFFKKNSILKKN